VGPAQLQFKIEAVDPSEEFLFGVRTTYRAFSKDTAIEIIDDDEHSLIPLEPSEVHVHDHPLPNPDKGRPSGGFHVLERLPTLPINPSPFIKGSKVWFKVIYYSM
jgi:hypothetical protein